MASAKPMNIYMGVGVTAFQITWHVEKTIKQMWQYKLSFSKYVFQQNIHFPIYKSKSKKLLFDVFSFFSSFFNVLLYVNCQIVFRWLASFLRRFFFSFFKESTLECLEKIQVQIIVFNKKALVQLSGISSSKNPPWNLGEFCSNFFLVDMSRKVSWIF